MMRTALIFGFALLGLLVDVMTLNAQAPVLDGLRNCVREDRGRPVCEMVANGKYTFVSEEFLVRYQNLIRQSVPKKAAANKPPVKAAPAATSAPDDWVSPGPAQTGAATTTGSDEWIAPSAAPVGTTPVATVPQK
jgi:hypothetical protein